MKFYSKASIVVLVLNIGWNSFAQSLGVLSIESFNYPTGSQLSSQNGGIGWAGGWITTDAAAASAYVNSNEAPLSYSKPSISAYYISPGYLYGINAQGAILGRNFDTSPSGPYKAWVDQNGSLNTNYSGFVHFLLRKATNDDSQIYFGFSDGLTSTNVNAGVAIGYFGPLRSNTNGKRYWTISWPNGTYQKTNREIVPNNTEYFMFGMVNSATSGIRNIAFYSNPTIQNGWDGLTLANMNIPFKFKSVFFYAEGGNSLDEIRSVQQNNLSQGVIYDPLFKAIGIDGL